MIMNDMSVKPTNLLDPQANKSTGGATATAVAGLATSFKDLVSKVGINFDTGLSDISGKLGITAVGDNVQSHRQADDHGAEARDDGRERFADRGGDDRAEGDRSDPQRAERADNEPRDNNTAHRDDNRDDGRDPHDGARDDGQPDKPAHAEKPTRDDRQGGDETAHDGADGKAAKTDGSGDGANTNGQHAGNGENTGNGQPGQTLAQQTGTAAQSLDTTAIISAVGGIAHAESGPASEAGKTNAAAALAAAATATQKQAGIHSAQTNAGQHQGQGAQSQNANANAGTQNTDPNAKAATNLQQQTAQLAQALGQDTKVKVDVAVSREAETLTSRPSAALTAATALTGDNKGQAQTGPQNANHANANAQNAAAQASAAQGQGGQAQAQNQQAGGQNAQAQTAQANATAGGPSAGASGVHSGGTTAGGGEQANAANATNAGAQQSQQSQQAHQAAQTARPRQPMQSSVAEQVSVKITKALQAGQDRITIRLNPAELGRVEVKMELTHDGRTTAIVTADNRDTLDLLRRDSSDLQKALEEGGLQLSDGDLTFNLRGEEGQMAEDGDGGPAKGGEEEELADEFVDTEPEIIVAHEGGVLINGRLDVRA